jgi:hypothetical protein
MAIDREATTIRHLGCAVQGVMIPAGAINSGTDLVLDRQKLWMESAGSLSISIEGGENRPATRRRQGLLTADGRQCQWWVCRHDHRTPERQWVHNKVPQATLESLDLTATIRDFRGDRRHGSAELNFNFELFIITRKIALVPWLGSIASDCRHQWQVILLHTAVASKSTLASNRMAACTYLIRHLVLSVCAGAIGPALQRSAQLVVLPHSS